MSNSSLATYTSISPNKTSPRTQGVDRITPHCVVGQLSAESICGCFTSPSRQASCNYGIGTDGRISICVEEKDRSWCSSSGANDHRAITIECASDKTAPYAMNGNVYESLIELCVDICKRYGKSKLIWFGDKDNTLNYSPKSDEMIITVHRWFANKSCPGDWLYNRLGDLAAEVTKRLGGTSSAPSTPSTFDESDKAVYTGKAAATPSFSSYKVRVTTDVLNVRKGAGTNYGTNGSIKDRGVYTIVAEASGTGANKWGKLESGAGWISLDYTKKV